MDTEFSNHWVWQKLRVAHCWSDLRKTDTLEINFAVVDVDVDFVLEIESGKANGT